MLVSEVHVESIMPAAVVIKLHAPEAPVNAFLDTTIWVDLARTIGLGSTCSQSDACSNRNAVCSGYCVCTFGYYDSNGETLGGSCLPKVVLGSTCTMPDACSDISAVCSGNTCLCTTGYYDSNGATLGGTCQQKVALGSTCPQPDACADNNAVCNGNMCVCKTGYYDSNGASSGGNCQQKVILGSTCTMSDACSDISAVCSGTTCLCTTGYYDSNGATLGGTCQQKVALGSTCPQPDACADNHAVCNGNMCVCQTGYYDSNGASSGGNCQQKVDLGSQCPQSDSCRTTNSQCGISPTNVASTCVCSAAYYDTNGVQPNGECRDVTSLQVTSVSYGKITEDTIPISWNTPSDQASVNYYLVEHRPVDNSTAGYSKNMGTNTTAVFSSLSTGKRYSITINSVNTQTASSIRSTPVKSYQITKPSIPRALLQTKDLNAISGNITLQWTSSVGVVTGYGGFLRNNTQLPYNQAFNTSGTVLEQTFSGVKNGTYYTFTVQAVCGYSDTSVLYSDIHMEIIKTRVQVPGSPSDIICSDPFDASLFLSWKATEIPNGDILHYIITVHKTYPHPETVYNVSTPSPDTTFTLNNLSEGSFYSLKIYTVNEMYESDNAAVLLSCKTRATIAGKPKDLAISNLTSRFGIAHWNRPNILNGVHYGYSIQIHNNDSCIREVIMKCSDCPGTIPSLISSGCSDTFERFVSSSELLGLQTCEAHDLLPDTNYIAAVSAITGIGRGQATLASFHTNEEVPKKPYDVKVETITATSADVVWKLDGPSPGDTEYEIVVTGDDPAGHKVYRMYGFYTRSFNMTSLEEYWNYTVTVQAGTSIGHNSSDPVSFQTSIGPPGKVVDVYVEKGSDGDLYVTAKISWKMPGILERNGPINSFNVQQEEQYRGNLIQMNSKEVLPISDESYTYNIVLPVLPEKTYRFTMTASNGHPFPGTETVVEYFAPAGPPVNIEEKGIEVISHANLSVQTQTSFQIQINVDFFMDQKNGQIRNQGNSSTMKTGEIDNLETYAKAKLSNSYVYRLALFEAYESTIQSGLRTILYNVGNESCDNRTVDEYCNGPLEPDSNYRIIAFVCTNGGCTLSRSYGPFGTLSDNLGKTNNFNSGSTQTIIIASTICSTLTLIAIIIALVVVKIMRARVTKRQSNPKAGDRYMDMVVTTHENIYEGLGSPVYDNMTI